MTALFGKEHFYWLLVFPTKGVVAYLLVCWSVIVVLVSFVGLWLLTYPGLLYCWPPFSVWSIMNLLLLNKVLFYTMTRISVTFLFFCDFLLFLPSSPNYQEVTDILPSLSLLRKCHQSRSTFSVPPHTEHHRHHRWFNIHNYLCGDSPESPLKNILVCWLCIQNSIETNATSRSWSQERLHPGLEVLKVLKSFSFPVRQNDSTCQRRWSGWPGIYEN